MKMITVRGEGIVLDAILAREYGPAVGRSLVVTTLDLNPGLAALGAILPLGTVITIPDRPAPERFPARAVVSLFG